MSGSKPALLRTDEAAARPSWAASRDATGRSLPAPRIEPSTKGETRAGTPHMHAVRRWACLAAAVMPALLAATVMGQATGAMAAPPSPQPAKRPGAAAAEPAQLTPAQVKAQIAAADELR